MIIDDLASEQQAMKTVVDSLGHETVILNSGEKALEEVKREKPNLILLDVVLPGIDGFQVCRKIKKDPETEKIPVILVSTKNQESDQFWGMKQGASQYLTKPIQTDVLAQALTTHLRG
jgi:twitching motility two-component system response regulator PilH